MKPENGAVYECAPCDGKRSFHTRFRLALLESYRDLPRRREGRLHLPGKGTRIREELH